jgi:hypothetical protein
MDLILSPASVGDAPALAALHTRVADHLTGQYGNGPWSSRTSLRGVLYAMRTSSVYVAREGTELVATLRFTTKKPWVIDASYFTPTKPTTKSVVGFIKKVKDEQQRKDSFVILEMMRKASKEEPHMWGNSLMGFGNVRHKSPATGREVDWFLLGFSPRKGNLSLHLMDLQRHAATLKKLGKFKTGMGCLYIARLSDVDLKILKSIIDATAQAIIGARAKSKTGMVQAPGAE